MEELPGYSLKANFGWTDELHISCDRLGPTNWPGVQGRYDGISCSDRIL